MAGSGLNLGAKVVIFLGVKKNINKLSSNCFSFLQNLIGRLQLELIKVFNTGFSKKETAFLRGSGV